MGDYNDSRKINSFVRILFILFILLVTGVFVFLMVDKTSENSSYEIGTNGDDLHGEFKRYDDRVYVAIPSNGYYEVIGVDQESFKPVKVMDGSYSEDYMDAHIGVDKNHVYCGNRIIPGMDQEKVISIGNNYYSDGENTYYCDRFSKRNEELAWYEEIYQTYRHKYLGEEKPQTYIYEMKAIPKSEKAYYVLEQMKTVTDGDTVYYEGEKMEKANPATLRPLKSYHVDLTDNLRTSYLYSGDGERVYFKNNLLSVSYDDSLYSLPAEPTDKDEYLIDPRDNMVFINGTAFDREKAPYILMTEHDSHMYHTLWLSERGIFFYDYRAKELKKAGENIFLDKHVEEIAPFVFCDGEETFFIDAYEVWHVGRRFRWLKSRNTAIYKLDNLPKGEWQEKKEARFYSVWDKGNKHYLFDNSGESQLIDSTVYVIIDDSAFDLLVSKEDINSSALREMIDEGKLTVPETSDAIALAESRFDDSWDHKVRKYGGVVLLSLIFFGSFIPRLIRRNQTWQD